MTLIFGNNFLPSETWGNYFLCIKKLKATAEISKILGCDNTGSSKKEMLWKFEMLSPVMYRKRKFKTKELPDAKWQKP